MPPEWAPHLACYLVWPHNRETWPGKFEVIPPLYADMVAAIAQFEPVRLMVNDEAQIPEIRTLIRKAARIQKYNQDATIRQIEIFYLPTNDSWVRDHGPIFVNRIDDGAGLFVGDQDAFAIRSEVLVPPGEERQEHRSEITTPVGQQVFVPRRVLAVLATLEDARIHQGIQPSR